jgi:hypothetical protein
VPERLPEGAAQNRSEKPPSVHSVTSYYSNTGRGIPDGVKKKASSIEKKVEGGGETNLVLIHKERVDPEK